MLVILGVWPNLDVYHSMCRGYVGRLIIMFIGIRSLPVKHFIQTSRELCVLSDRNRGLQISDLLHFVFAFFLLNFSGSFVFFAFVFLFALFLFFLSIRSYNQRKDKKNSYSKNARLRGLGSLTYPRSFLLILPLLS